MMRGSQRLKVCLVGTFKGPLDEGMRNTNEQLKQYLERVADVFIVEQRDLRSVAGWRQIRQCKPDVVHYLHGPTWRSLILCKAIKMVAPQSAMAILALNPLLPGNRRFWFPSVAPDVVFSVTRSFHDEMSSLGVRSVPVRLGVDRQRFKPPTKNERDDARKRFELDGRLLALHVGHFTVNRGLERIFRLQRRLDKWVQFVIVGSTTNQQEKEVVQKANNSGIISVIEYVPDIERIYHAADMYVFPSERLDAATDVPLTVLEAMACNLPVVTYPFGALPELCSDIEGFLFAKTDSEFEERIRELLDIGANEISTREATATMLWEEFGASIVRGYRTFNSVGKAQ